MTTASTAGGQPGRPVLERLTGDLAAAGGVRAVVLDDGSERGIRVLEFRTGGGLRFDVLVDRAMDIGLAEFDDLSVGWRSATGFRHPGLHEHNDEDGLSWLRSMSGLVVTAGLDHTLFGGQVAGDPFEGQAPGPRLSAGRACGRHDITYSTVDFDRLAGPVWGVRPSLASP